MISNTFGPSNTMQIIYVWPDNVWCHPHEVSAMNHRSDDCEIKFLPEEWDDEQIDIYIMSGQ